MCARFTTPTAYYHYSLAEFKYTDIYIYIAIYKFSLNKICSPTSPTAWCTDVHVGAR